MKYEKLAFVDIGFDFLAYACGVDSLKLDKYAF
jgi:hypothetical protein